MDDGKVKIGIELDPSKAKSQAPGIGRDIGSSISDATNQAAQDNRKAIQEIGKQVEGYGKAVSKAVTLPILGAAAASATAAVKIDTALTGVRKTVDGTEQEYEQLKQKAIEFSQTNAVDPAQILDIQALGAQLGYTIDELDMFGKYYLAAA